MPTFNQITDDTAEDPLDLPDWQWPSVADDHRRTNSDKSNIGIPADENCDWVIPYEQNSMLCSSSAGQVSYCHGSWETVSATSHGSSQSFQDPVYGQYHNPDSDPFAEGSNFLPVIANASSTQSMNELISLSSGAGPMADGYQIGTPDSITFTPETASPNPTLQYPDLQWPDKWAFRPDVESDAAQTDSLGSTGLDSMQTEQPTEFPSQYQYHDQVLRDLTLADHPNGSLRPVKELPGVDNTFDAPSTNYLDVPAVRPHLPHMDKSGQHLAVQQVNKKRKRFAPHKRDNVDKINSVRSIGACIRCALLHEPVS